MARVAVTGWREFKNYKFAELWILYVHHSMGIDLLIHGKARGLDTIAEMVAERYDILFKPYPADWKRYGRKLAGPIRNTQMLVEGKPDLLLAFMGKNGTANMIAQTRERGIPIIDTTIEVMPDDEFKAQALETIARRADRD